MLTKKEIVERIERTKTFVEDHKTTAACCATAVASVYMTRKIDTRLTMPMLYGAGHYAGQLEAMILTHIKFLDSRNMIEDFEQFVVPNAK